MSYTDGSCTVGELRKELLDKLSRDELRETVDRMSANHQETIDKYMELRDLLKDAKERCDEIVKAFLCICDSNTGFICEGHKFLYLSTRIKEQLK